MEIGVREIILGLIGLLALYLGWLILRFVFTRPKKRRRDDPVEFGSVVEDAVTIQSEIVGGVGDRSFSSVSFDSTELGGGEREGRRVKVPREPDASEFGFDALLEVRQMRHVVDELKATLEAQAREIDALKEQLADVRAASQVSPLYGEAVALARRGYDAMAIAERCGISVAEAELVRSLSGEPGEGANNG